MSNAVINVATILLFRGIELNGLELIATLLEAVKKDLALRANKSQLVSGVKFF